MFITTAGRTDEKMIKIAKEAAQTLAVPYISRNKKSIPDLQNKLDSQCIVVGKERLELFQKGNSSPFFFHPNSAMFRIKRLLKNEQDPFAEVTRLQKGMSFLDCTLGLASDSIVASFLVGKEGSVTGVEGQKHLAYIVKNGLETWKSGLSDMNCAMKNIKVVHSNSLDYLKGLPDGAVDCVYFDPMFEGKILESDGIKALGHFAISDDLDRETMKEAYRVARMRIILKDHYQSSRFERFGFTPIRRKTAKFHFGFIDK